MLNYNTYQIRVDENSTVVILNYNPKPSNDLMNEIDSLQKLDQKQRGNPRPLF